MNKKSYLVTLILMPIALVGLIFIQIYWVKSSIDNKEDAFSDSIRQVLGSVSKAVELKEINQAMARFIELKRNDSLGSLKSGQVWDLSFVQEDKKTKETFNNAVSYSAKKISSSSSFSIKTKEDLDNLIEKSGTTEFVSKT